MIGVVDSSKEFSRPAESLEELFLRVSEFYPGEGIIRAVGADGCGFLSSLKGSFMKIIKINGYGFSEAKLVFRFQDGREGELPNLNFRVEVYQDGKWFLVHDGYTPKHMRQD